MQKNSGLIQLIFLIIVAIFVLSFFGISIQNVFEEGPFMENLSYSWDQTKAFWANYLFAPFSWIWNNIIRPFVIDPLNNYTS